MIYELRIYEAAPGMLPKLNARFQNVTLPIWERHGFRPVGFWTSDIGTSNELTYMLAWEDLAERERKFAAFQADPEWIEKRAQSEAGGPLLVRFRNSILRPTPYSPMQ